MKVAEVVFGRERERMVGAPELTSASLKQSESFSFSRLVSVLIAPEASLLKLLCMQRPQSLGFLFQCSQLCLQAPRGQFRLLTSCFLAGFCPGSSVLLRDMDPGRLLVDFSLDL